MRKSKIPLLGQIVIAIVLGIVLGRFMPVGGARVFATFNNLFGNFLSFIIPLIIVGLVTPAIGELGKSAGRLLLITVALAYASTLFSGFFTYFSCEIIFPKIMVGGFDSGNMTAIDEEVVSPFFSK